MKYIKGFYMALGMFCGIPLPFHIWDEKLTSIMVASLPLIGLIIGSLWWVTGLILTVPALPIMMVSAILTVVPFLIAGFIHLDGFMDTSDALLSRRPLEDRLRILKDPRVGAFAVVMLVVLFLLQFSAMYSVVDGRRYLALLIIICVISRCCSALSIFLLRHSSISHYGSLLSQNTRKGHKFFVLLVGLVAITLSYLYAGIIGLSVSVAVVLGFTLAMRTVYKTFEGISGDLLGYLMVIGELFGLIALALLQGLWVNI